jgi:hypothetical protein
MEVPEEQTVSIKRMHGGSPRFAQPVPLRETLEGKTVWEGVVHVFDSPAIVPRRMPTPGRPRSRGAGSSGTCDRLRVY